MEKDMEALQDFRQLRVWQAGIELVKDFYKATAGFPGEERFGLVNQMRRAAVSVPSNIAEGNSQQSIKGYLKHLSIARGSLGELYTQVELAAHLNFLEKSQAKDLQHQCQSLLRQLLALRKSLQSRVP